MEFSFTHIYKMLKSDEYYNVSPEIEILKGEYIKISDYKDVLRKAKRKRKYNK